MAKSLRYFAHDLDDDLHAKDFPFAPRFIFDLFELEFGKCPSRDIGKLIVRYTADSTRHLQVEDLVDVLVVREHFDAASVAQLDEPAQKRYFLDSILIAIRENAARYGWDVAQAEAAHQRIVDTGIVFDRWWGKRVKHSKSKVAVQVRVIFDATARLFLGVFAPDGTLQKEIPITTAPGSIGAITDACGSLRWIDDRHVRLERVNKRDNWDINIESEVVESHESQAASRRK